MTRLARTTGRAGMNLGDKSARVHLGLTLGLRADKRPAWKQLWPLRKRKATCLEISQGERRGEGSCCAEKTDKTHFEAAMKDELFKQAPARFRGSVHREKMAVFTYKMFSFLGWLKQPPAIQGGGGTIEASESPLTRGPRMRA